MKHINMTVLFTVLMSMTKVVAYAHDFGMKNSDGVTIYYVRTGSSVSVTYRGSSYSTYSNEYSGNVVIPETVTYNGKNYNVTSIAGSAFRGCSGLTSVAIPNSVTSIGSSAFYGCSGLTSIIIPDSVTSINSYAFSGCSGLISITIPNSVTNIASSAFSGCSGLISVTIPDSVTSIASSAFSGCSSLTTITIPDSVTSIASSAFENCSGLTSIIIPSNVTSIDKTAFTGCNGLTSITWNVQNYPAFSDVASSPFYRIRSQITEFIMGDELINVPSFMCYGMSNLTLVTIPDSVTSIGTKAFEGCSSLNAINIPSDVTSIGSYAFYGCTKLGTVILPTQLKTIDDYTFYNCTSLNAINIPNDVTSIGSYAFYGCSKLGTVILPAQLKTIDDYTFYNCSSLNAINIPNDVTSIGSYAFYGCSKLGTVILPAQLKTIGDYTFYNCTSLNAIKFPNTVSSIGSYAFYNSGLIAVTLPDSITTINSYTFRNCSKLISLTISKNVTKIKDYAFCDCTDLRKIIWLPVTQPTLSDTYCNNSIAINYVSSSGYKPFYKGKSFSPGEFYSWGYDEGSSLSLSYSYSPKVIYQNLRSMFEVDGIKYIPDDSTHHTCVAIDCVYDGEPYDAYIGKTVSYMGMDITVSDVKDYIFYNCKNIKSATIEADITTISADAFKNCTNLTSVTIPKTVTSLSDGAFTGCTEITEITCFASTPPTCVPNNMSDINKEICTLYVPYNSVNSYEIADEWSTFLYIKPILSSYNLGDANGDDKIDVADFTAIASYILGCTPETFVDVAADVNCDMAINVADITGVSNIILYGTQTSSASAKAISFGGKEFIKPELRAKDFAISAGGEYVMDIDIENPDMLFSACQFDVHLPKGISIKSVTLGNDRTTSKKTNYLDFAQLADGTTRVICASTKDIAFAGTEGTVARLTVVADNDVEAGSYDVTIDNIVLSKGGDMAKPESVTINADISSATGISEIKTAEPNSADGMYDILGRRISNSEKLRDGIYIIGGKKVIK